MENDAKSTGFARRLCAKHPDATLCIEWNPQQRQWRAVTEPGAQPIDLHARTPVPQAKCVLVGHFREDGTMAAQSPKDLAGALAALMAELKVTAPRKISLTGVCYTAPALDHLADAADSLAGQFALALHEEGLDVPVTAIDGEVVVDDQGRKHTVLPDGPGFEAARLRKVTLTANGRGGVLAERAPVAPLSHRALAVLQGNSARKQRNLPSSPPRAPFTPPASSPAVQPDAHAQTSLSPMHYKWPVARL